MPIQIREYPEPLTTAARTNPPRLVESEAFRQLRHALNRYCRGEITGRSFLISGHRGAGKTTIVAHAFERVLRDYEQSRGGMLRPLFVSLHGPSLLPARRARSESSPGEMSAGEMSAETKSVLEQITLALHRAVTREVVAAYRARVEELSAQQPERSRELFELAAALEIELYEPPTPARLREFWSLADSLDAGILSSLAPGSRTRDVDAASPKGQGLRELVALAAVCEAYRRISGTFTQEDTSEDTASASEERSAGAETSKEVWGAFASLLFGSGAAIGTVSALPGRPVAAAFVGILSAFGSAGVIKFSVARKRERSMSRHYRFLANLSVETLDRNLPVVIERLHAAGLAPVFAIDELDKVIDLSSRIRDMVHDLKKLVAESAFFAFITDRWYFESISDKRASSGYPVEHTYFGDRLFIVFRPEELHAFVQEVIPIPDTPSTAPNAEVVLLTDRADHPMLEYVVLHRSRMHAIDLRREIDTLRDDEGEVGLAGGQVRSERAFRFDTRIQLSIELVLGDVNFRADLDDDPNMRRLAYDAMYYPSRRWVEAPEESLDLSPAGQDAFRDYLIGRMGRDNEAPGRADNGALRSRATLAVSDDTVDTLFGYVGELVKVISSNKELNDRVARANERRPNDKIPQEVLDALTTTEPPLIRRDATAGLWKWLYFPSGRVQPGVELPSTTPGDAWGDAVRFINAIEKAIREAASK